MILYASSGREEISSFGGIEWVIMRDWNVETMFSAIMLVL
jgi:hypothetical protein